MTGTSAASAIAEKCRTRPSGEGRLYIGETERIPSAPASTASRAQKTAFAVWLPPAPAMTGTRPAAAFTTAAVTPFLSSPESVADSPVVPHGTRKSMPRSICHSTSAVRARKSIRPFSSKGVTSAVPQPFQSTRYTVPPYGTDSSLSPRLTEQLTELEDSPPTRDALGGPDRAPGEPGPPAGAVDELHLVLGRLEDQAVKAGHGSGPHARDRRRRSGFRFDDPGDPPRRAGRRIALLGVVLFDPIGGVSRGRVELRAELRELEELSHPDREVRGVDESSSSRPEFLDDPRELAIPTGRSADDRRARARERAQVLRGRRRIRELEDHVRLREPLARETRAAAVLPRTELPHDVVAAPGRHRFDLAAHLSGPDDAETHAASPLSGGFYSKNSAWSLRTTGSTSR